MLKPRTIGICAAVSVLALVGSFSAGRFSAPLKVETRDVEHVVYKDKIVEVVKTVTVKEAARVVYRDRVITKDGTVTEHEVERTDTKVSIADNRERTATLSGEKITEHTQIVTLRPNWRVAILAGAQWPTPLIPIYGPIVLGIEADYRIIGGLSVGLWLNTGGAAGIALAFEF